MAGGPEYGAYPGPTDRISLHFPAGEQRVRDILCRLSDLLQRRGCAPVLVEDAIIVLAEVLNNVEEHAYAGDAGGPVRVEVLLWGRMLDCIVEDRGRPLQAGALPGHAMPAPDPVAPDTWPEGGFGWAMMRRLTQELIYERENGCNRLRFRVTAETPVGIG